MSELKDKVINDVTEILGWKVQVEKVQRVPEHADLTLGETAKEFQAAAMFVDVRDSSRLTEVHRPVTAMKVYNAFLNGVVRIIRSQGGHIRSFNGDGVLAFFDSTGGEPSIIAVRTAKKIMFFVRNVLLPKLNDKEYARGFDAGIGIDYGKILTTKVGIRKENNNDLVWPATATNLAAKLGGKGERPFNICVSEEVYSRLPAEMKHSPSWWPEAFATWYWKWDSFEFADKRTRFLKTDGQEDF